MLNIVTHKVKTWLENHDHEVHTTVRFPPSISLQRAHDLYRQEVLIPLRRRFQTLITAATILTPGSRDDVLGDHQPHLHSLVTTQDRCLPSDVSELYELAHSLRTKKSKLLDHKRAIVITPYIQSKHPGYWTKHMDDNEAIIELYGLATMQTTKL